MNINSFRGMNPIFRPIDLLAIPQEKTSCLCSRMDTDFAKFQAVVHWDDAQNGTFWCLKPIERIIRYRICYTYPSEKY